MEKLAHRWNQVGEAENRLPYNSVCAKYIVLARHIKVAIAHTIGKQGELAGIEYSRQVDNSRVKPPK